jgi:phosphohistidine phosphatase
MDLILWRHAEAEDGADDLARALTPKGLKQAARMAEWLRARLPGDTWVLASPAVRAQQTVAPLGLKVETSALIAPGAAPAAVLKAAGWPDGRRTALVVGHQPTLGMAIASAVAGEPSPWRVKKGAVWWLSSGADTGAAVVLAMMTPQLL